MARAGYIEVPSRLEEQSYGIQGPWVGWGHHHWLVDVGPGSLEFVFKHHVVHGMEAAHFPAGFHDGLREEERVQTLWWQQTLVATERTFVDAEGLDGYLASFVAEELQRRGSAHRRVAAERLRAAARVGRRAASALAGASGRDGQSGEHRHP